MKIQRIVLVAAALLSLATLPRLAAQDDVYVQVKFVNESPKDVSVTIRNPRVGAPATWKVQSGKAQVLSNTEGNPARIGLYSSFIRVAEAEEKPLLDVVAMGEDRLRVVTWTAGGFKPAAPVKEGAKP